LVINLKKVKEMAKKCVECGDHVPAYMNFLCESCWKKALNEKLQEDDKKHLEEAKQVDVENPHHRWFR
jgi:NMD protein affecting ribosome stability and mRNA decay